MFVFSSPWNKIVVSHSKLSVYLCKLTNQVYTSFTVSADSCVLKHFGNVANFFMLVKICVNEKWTLATNVPGSHIWEIKLSFFFPIQNIFFLKFHYNQWNDVKVHSLLAFLQNTVCQLILYIYKLLYWNVVWLYQYIMGSNLCEVSWWMYSNSTYTDRV